MVEFHCRGRYVTNWAIRSITTSTRYIIESTDKTGRMGPLLFLGQGGDTEEIMLAGNSLNITHVFEVRPGIMLLDG